MEQYAEKFRNAVNTYDDYFFKLLNLKELTLPQLYSLVLIFLIALWDYLNIFAYNTSTNYHQIFLPCWPFFTSCHPLQNIVLLNFDPILRNAYFPIMMIIFSGALVALFNKKFGISYTLAGIVYFFSVFLIIVSSDGYNAQVHHQVQYIFYIGLILFLARHSRIQLLTLFLFLTYLFSTIPKILSEVWLVGYGIPTPYMPDILKPIGTNSIILLQLILPLLILFANRTWRYISIITLELFHFYSMSISIVRYSFFWVTIPFIYLLFVEFFEGVHAKAFKNNLGTNIVFVVYIFLSLVRLAIPGDDQITTEGSSYALNMFNTMNNYIKVDADFGEKTQMKDVFPYMYVYQLLQELQRNCVDDTPRHLALTVGNGFSTRKIIDEPNYCTLTYKPFSHNEWIHSPPLESWKDLSVLNSVQLFFYNQEIELQNFYMFIFYSGFLFTVYKIFFEEKMKTKNE